MSCDCQATSTEAAGDRKTLRIALGLNAAMFVIGMAAGVWAQSTSLMADALDMLADASSYGIALLAMTRGADFKRASSRWSGGVLLALGIGIVVEVARRAYGDSEPQGALMMVFSLLSLAVNITVLKMLGKFRQGEAHLRATWIFTRVDVIANVGVLASGLLVLLTGFGAIDLVVGAAIGLYVIKEAVEIVRDSGRSAQEDI
jgi:cation diffusion facilitator family transporter